jgi:DNA polymerase III gamma/tau subunit
MSILNLDGFQGSAGVAAQLKLAFSEGRLPHAMILEGFQSGLPQILAAAAVCLDDEKKPCGHCSGCVKARAGSHPDIFTLDGDENPRAFPVDAIRQLRSDAYVKPNEAPSKVYLLLGAQNMSDISQNALLKVLEEPPENVHFILTASSAAALLPTVRSRAQVFSLESARTEDPIDPSYLQTLAAAIIAVNESDLLFHTADLIKNKEKLRAVLNRLLLLFRDSAVLRAGGCSCLSGLKESAEALAAALPRNKLLALFEEVKKAQRALDQNANSTLLVTALCANLRSAAGR